MRRIRILTLLTLLVTAAPAAAYAGTTLGGTHTPTDDSCTAPGQVFQVAAPDGSSTAVPAAGVLTSWSFQAGAQVASVELRVFRSAATANTYTVVATSGGVQDIAPSTGLRTFPTRVTVSSGDYVGLRTDTIDEGACLKTGAGADFLFRASMSTPGAVGSSDTYGLVSGTAINISAVWEPDADRDGYGDESQDQCPASATTQSTCPRPDTKIKKVKVVGKDTKVTFSATVKGSTFTCSLDGKKAKACTSPMRYRCLAPGKHVLKVTATSPIGITEAKAAKKRFSSQQLEGC